MLTIRGIYDGKKIDPLEEIPFKEKRNVIITFLEEPVEETNIESEIDPMKALRGCAKRSNLRGKLLESRRKDLKYEEEKRQNLNAYKKLRKEILQKYEGKYVAIAKGKLVAVAPTFDEAVEASRKAVPDFLHRFVFQADDEPITEPLYVSTTPK